MEHNKIHLLDNKRHANKIKYTKSKQTLPPKKTIKPIPNYWKDEIVWVRKGKISKAIKAFNLDNYKDWEITTKQEVYGSRFY